MTVAEAETETEAPAEGKKGSKKKLIMMVLLIVLIGFVVAKKTVLKPPPLTPQQKAEQMTLEKYELEAKCARANHLPPPPRPKIESHDAKKGEKSEGKAEGPDGEAGAEAEEEPVIGPVLELESKTLNLAGGHFLKIGLALQLPAGVPVKEVAETENWGALTGQVVLNTFAGAEMDEILPTKTRERLRHEIGREVCVQSEGEATTVYFTEFVAQ
jgi:flagellar basal body-associated protein FliL